MPSMMPRGRRCSPMRGGRACNNRQPALQGIFRSEVIGRGLPHTCRRCQPFTLPCQASVDGPPQDRRPLGLELLAEIGVALARRDGDCERYKVQPAANGLVDAAQRHRGVRRGARWSAGPTALGGGAEPVACRLMTEARASGEAWRPASVAGRRLAGRHEQVQPRGCPSNRSRTSFVIRTESITWIAPLSAGA
jgi:hypothetical protein